MNSIFDMLIPPVKAFAKCARARFEYSDYDTEELVINKLYWGRIVYVVLSTRRNGDICVRWAAWSWPFNKHLDNGAEAYGGPFPGAEKLAIILEQAMEKGRTADLQ